MYAESWLKGQVCAGVVITLWRLSPHISQNTLCSAAQLYFVLPVSFSVCCTSSGSVVPQLSICPRPHDSNPSDRYKYANTADPQLNFFTSSKFSSKGRYIRDCKLPDVSGMRKHPSNRKIYARANCSNWIGVAFSGTCENLSSNHVIFTREPFSLLAGGASPNNRRHNSDQSYFILPVTDHPSTGSPNCISMSCSVMVHSPIGMWNECVSGLQHSTKAEINAWSRVQQLKGPVSAWAEHTIWLQTTNIHKRTASSDPLARV
ncbi:hypothetical protein G2W53_008741 [Senna tora]|uniref:Uncharacterized protein n=1 Tax=Senna tora TaxID=362788 RepID=A0A835CBE8_9FABA|nr:hypothetical protein G2W53_008741 [Senna tora]